MGLVNLLRAKFGERFHRKGHQCRLAPADVCGPLQLDASDSHLVQSYSGRQIVISVTYLDYGGRTLQRRRIVGRILGADEGGRWLISAEPDNVLVPGLLHTLEQADARVLYVWLGAVGKMNWTNLSSFQCLVPTIGSWKQLRRLVIPPSGADARIV
jgi:hypothetical protein